MPKGIEFESSQIGTFVVFMGYGGLEFGYILYSSDKIKVGTNLLLAYVIGFTATMPKSKNGNFQIFPVDDPFIYALISLGKILKLDIGTTCCYAGVADFPYINSEKLNGFSSYHCIPDG